MISFSDIFIFTIRETSFSSVSLKYLITGESIQSKIFVPRYKYIVLLLLLNVKKDK